MERDPLVRASNTQPELESLELDPYRTRLPEIHELVLAWLLEDEEAPSANVAWDRPAAPRWAG